MVILRRYQSDAGESVYEKLVIEGDDGLIFELMETGVGFMIVAPKNDVYDNHNIGDDRQIAVFRKLEVKEGEHTDGKEG